LGCAYLVIVEKMKYEIAVTEITRIFEIKRKGVQVGKRLEKGG